MFLGNILNNQVAGGATVYHLPGTVMAPLAVAFNYQIIKPFVLSGFSLTMSGVAQPAGGALVASINKNNTPTAAILTFPPGSVNLTLSSLERISFAIGDLLIVQLTNYAVPASGTLSRCSCLAEF
jgi:hypothetical protein